jgi:hypothetical protein
VGAEAEAEEVEEEVVEVVVMVVETQMILCSFVTRVAQSQLASRPLLRHHLKMIMTQLFPISFLR